MLSIELAGRTLTYKNAPHLNMKARVLLEELRGERRTLEKQSKALRRQEYLVARFLGDGKEVKSDNLTEGLSAATRSKEEKSHA